MLRLKTENELHKLGLGLDPSDPSKFVRLDGPIQSPGSGTVLDSPAAALPLAMSAPVAIQIPAGGNLVHLPDGELWNRLRGADDEIRSLQKEIIREETHLTALRWRRGQILIEIKRRVGHGQFLTALAAKKIQSQRASEDIRIAEHYPSEEDAGKVSIAKALKTIKRSDDTYGPFENCFATPEWLKKAIEREYGFPGLDVASSHGVYFGERFYTPVEDGLVQDWLKDCGGKPVWMNCPYNMSVLPNWVKYGYEQSQRGLELISLLPYWRNYPWFSIVKDYAEVRLPGARVVFDGFGPKAGKKCGNILPSEFESVIAIFRKGQKGFCSNWLDP
jgi:hypothetical protein